MNSRKELPPDIASTVRRALSEDIGKGDLTAELIDPGARDTADGRAVTVASLRRRIIVAAVEVQVDRREPDDGCAAVHPPAGWSAASRIRRP